jgi:hypothetical protein
MADFFEKHKKELMIGGGVVLGLAVVGTVVGVVVDKKTAKATAAPKRMVGNNEVDPDAQKTALGAALDRAQLGGGAVKPGTVTETGIAASTNGKMVFDSRLGAVAHSTEGLSAEDKLKHDEFNKYASSSGKKPFIPSMTQTIADQRNRTLAAQRARRTQPRLEHSFRRSTIRQPGEPMVGGGIHADTLTASRTKSIGKFKVDPRLVGPGVIGQSPYILDALTEMVYDPTSKRHSLQPKMEYGDPEITL